MVSLRKSIEKDQIFGNWKVIDPGEKRYVQVICLLCNKTIKKVDYTILINDKYRSDSCGCKIKTSSKRHEMLNKTYSYLTVIDTENRYVKCRCICDKEIFVDYLGILSENNRSCGYYIILY